jgi:uncharacterized membrane-anchored protein YhcB (DUF1043 family)
MHKKEIFIRRWFAIIAGLVLGIGFGCIQYETTQHGANRDDLGIHFFNKQAATLTSELKRYKDLHGHYPSNDEGLYPVLNAAQRRMDKDSGYHVRTTPK